MTDEQDFWFPVQIGQESGPAYLIKIPKACTICGEPFQLSVEGSASENSFLYKPCSHVWDWNDLLKMGRKVSGPSAQGKSGHCIKCDKYNEYQTGPYTCFTCK